jgi:hypothetical protein
MADVERPTLLRGSGGAALPGWGATFPARTPAVNPAVPLALATRRQNLVGGQAGQPAGTGREGISAAPLLSYLM